VKTHTSRRARGTAGTSPGSAGTSKMADSSAPAAVAGTSPRTSRWEEPRGPYLAQNPGYFLSLSHSSSPMRCSGRANPGGAVTGMFFGGLGFNGPCGSGGGVLGVSSSAIGSSVYPISPVVHTR
jgi:hypothetical protein